MSDVHTGLKHIFYVPEFAPGPLLLKLSGLNSIESEPKVSLILKYQVWPSHWRNLIFSITLKHGITAPFSLQPKLENIVRGSIIRFEKSAWHSYCDTHHEMQIASSCLANVTPFHFWSLADHFPDLVSRLHVQVRLMSQFGVSGSIPGFHDSDGTFCFVCKQDVESVTHFLLDCSYFKQNILLFGEI